MNTFIRWAKFNMVGAIGMAVQLAALALFNRLMAGHYLYASAAAIELTLLHNFIWHIHYTWRDRRDSSTTLHQLLRFHLSNGLVSMLGNLLLMRLLVHEAHVPLLLSNIVAILCCSIINFYLGNRWVFARLRKAGPSPTRKTSTPKLSLPLVSLLLLLGGAMAHAQSTPALLPEAPTQQPPSKSKYTSRARDSYIYHAGAFCGIGATTSSVSTKPTTGCGMGLTFVPWPVFFEFGLMAPQANRSNYTGYISLDGSIPLARQDTKYLPMAIVGYSRLFETGHALDYGLALATPRFGKPKDASSSLRLELRDYWTFANPAQHNIMLRIGWMGEVAD